MKWSNKESGQRQRVDEISMFSSIELEDPPQAQHIAKNGKFSHSLLDPSAHIIGLIREELQDIISKKGFGTIQYKLNKQTDIAKRGEQLEKKKELMEQSLRLA